MTVNELIIKLQEIDNKNRVIILQKDGEGNGYSPLSDCWNGIYVADNTWSGEAWEEEEIEENEIENGEKAIFLTPIN